MFLIFNQQNMFKQFYIIKLIRIFKQLREYKKAQYFSIDIMI